MNKIIHFFDLDGTLWDVNTRAWIILKKYPNDPLIKLSNGQLTDILFGVYKNDEIKIQYNGQEYYLSKQIFNKIQKSIPNIKEDQLGLSFTEKVNPLYHKKLIFNKENIRHLINTKEIDIGILSGRYSEEDDHKLLSLLKKELDNIGLEINKFYYVSDFFKPIIDNNINYKKMNVLLEHLVGFKIKDDHFLPIKQDLYKEVHFYDDEFQNINTANNLQEIFEEYLRKTDDDVYNRIMLRINEIKPILYTHLVTNNSLKRFKTVKIELQKPKKFPIKIEENNKFISNFQNYIKNKYDSKQLL